MSKIRIVKNKFLMPAMLSLLGLFIVATLLYTGVIWPNTLFVSHYSVRGLDVSSYQKQVDWRRVAATGEYAFVFIKASEGTYYRDAFFQANWRGTKAQGLLHGAYHYFSDFEPGSAQAANYISMVPREAGMLPPVLDLEVSGKDHAGMLREIRAFLDRLEQYYGMRPIIYTDHERYDEYIRGSFANYTIWIRDVITPVQWSDIHNWAF